jgi:hypothetical protein
MPVISAFFVIRPLTPSSLLIDDRVAFDLGTDPKIRHKHILQSDCPAGTHENAEQVP